MRFLLALLAVMALLVNPVTVSAAEIACAVAPTMVNVDALSMPGMARSGSLGQAVDPCCNPAGQHKSSTKNCAQFCAASSVVNSTETATMVGVTLTYTRVPLFTARLLPVGGVKPTGPERPPKLMV